MKAELYWIDGAGCRLGIMPHPQGGPWLPDEIRSLKEQGVDVLVSMLTPEEVVELGLRAEPELCTKQGIAFMSFPISDHGLPEDRKAFVAKMRDIHRELDNGRGVAIHCRAGIGRSGLSAGYLLTLRGISPAEAFDLISLSRWCRVPDTPAQRRWVEELVAEPPW